MREGWKKVNLDNSVVDIIDGDRGSNYPKQDEFFDNGYCLFLNTGNVTVNGFNFEKTQFVTKEKDDLLRKGKLRRNDIVLTTRGTVGNVAYYDDSVPFDNVRINSGMVVLRIDSEQTKLYTKYFYHFLKSSLFKEQVLSHASGSAQPQLPIKDMKQIELTLPPYETQRRIAAILSALDDKIELNLQTNQTLEAIAQALFKEWFVDFNFPGATGEMQESELGPIPVGWRVGKLEDIASIKHGFAFKGDYFSEEKTDDILVTPGNFRIGGGFNYSKFKYYDGVYPSEYLLNRGDLIITMTDLSKEGDTLGYPALVPQIYGKKLLHNQRVGKIEFSKNSMLKMFLYFVMRQNDYRNYILSGATGTTVRHTSPGRVCDYMLIIPTTTVLKQFEELLQGLMDSIEFSFLQNQILAHTRDNLLPKLMSGEIVL